MICSDVKIEGKVSIGNENVIQNIVSLIANNTIYDIETPIKNSSNEHDNDSNNDNKGILI
jgi:hypothetical protein